MNEPAWMTVARRELGVHETPGIKHTERIIEYHQATALKATEDEVPWCSSFACWCMAQAGIPSTRSAAARSWLTWGVPTEPRYGCVVVFRRGSSSWTGHVGFYVASGSDAVLVLDGNVGNAVRLSWHPRDSVLGYRWPEGMA